MIRFAIGLIIFVNGFYCALAQDEPLQMKPLFRTSLLQDVNSKRNDFCPVVFENKIVFVSERESDFLNIGEDRSKRELNLAVQYSEITGRNDSMKFSRPRLFSEQLSVLYHSGPITFTKDGNYAILTGVEFYKDKDDSVYRPRIYSTSRKKNSWSKPELLGFIQKGYSYSHPCLSADGQHLYFISDMAGGYGKKDIYMSKRDGNSWGEPVNLGPVINNEGNQLFPYVQPDGTIYFTSDGHRGLGGLDLFYSKRNGESWSKVTNLGSTINSTSDDFGIFFNEDNETGYFSSGRPGGIGGDDLYRFSVVWIPPPKPAQLYLLGPSGDTLMVAVRNEEGFFSFRKLPFDRKYSFLLSADSTFADDEVKLMLADLRDKILFTTAVRDSGNFFKYEYLPGEKIRLYLISRNGDTLLTSTRTRDEFFVFSRLPISESRMFLLDEKVSDPYAEIKLVIHDDKGNVLFTTATQDKTNRFSYRFLADEKVKIFMINESGNTIAISTKDKDGYFLFRKLPPDIPFLFLLEEQDTVSPEIKLIEYDEKGRGRVIIIGRGKDGRFRFVKLPYKEAKLCMLSLQGDTLMIAFPDELGNFVFNALPTTSETVFRISGGDPALLDYSQVIFKSGNVEVVTRLVKDAKGDYTTGKLPFSGARLYVISPQGDTLLVARRDGKGNFIFEKLPLLPNYMFTFTHVDPSLVNNATILFKKKDGEDVALVLQRDKLGKFPHEKLPFAESKLYLISLRGDTLMVAVMNEKGQFVFEKLPPNPNYMFSFSGDDPGLIDTALVIFRKPGQEDIVIEAAKKEDGFFHHEKLPFAVAKLYLLNLNGDTLMVARQDEHGNFIFDKLPPQQHYIFAIESSDPDAFKNADIIFASKSGDRIKVTAIRGHDNLFRHEKLPFNEAKLYIISENGDTLMIATPNAQGFFVFEKLPHDVKYFFAADPRAVDIMSDLQIIYMDARGKKTTAHITKDPKHSFRYRSLPEISALATTEKTSEPKLQKETKMEPVPPVESVTVYYELKKAVVPKEYNEALRGIAEKMKENPKYKVRVKGYTDDVGSLEDNLDLSRKRAYNVGRKLMQLGIPATKIRTNYYGEKKPVAPNRNPDGSDNPEGRAKNRRVEVTVVLQ